MQKLTCLTLLLLIFDIAFGQPTQFRGENRDGIYPDTGLSDQWPAEGLPVVATIEGIGDGFGSPSMNENGIFVAGMIDSQGYLFHFDHHQQLQWKVRYGKEFEYKYTGARGTPTLDGNRIYYSGTYGNTICLDNRTGELLWKRDIFNHYKGDTIKWGYTESPLVYRDLVFLTPGGPGHNIVALDKMTGDLTWRVDLDSAANSYNSPVLVRHGEKDLIMMNTTSRLLFLHPGSGEIAFSHPLTHSRMVHPVSPLYLDGKVFYSSGYGEGCVLLRINEGARRMDTIFTNSDLDNRLSGLIHFHGIVYGTSDRKKQWVGVDLSSGETVFTTRKLKPGSFLMADGKFYIFTETGEVALARPDNEGFTVKSRFSIPAQPARHAFAHPVLHKGMLYIRYKEYLWLYDVRDKS